MENQLDRQLILTPDSVRTLEQIDEALQRNFGMSLAVTDGGGDIPFIAAGVPEDNRVALCEVGDKTASEGQESAVSVGGIGRVYTVPVTDGGGTPLGALLAFPANGIRSLVTRANERNLFSLLRPFAALIADAAGKEAALDGLADEVARRYEEITFVYDLAGSMRADSRPELSIGNILKSAIEHLDLDILVMFRSGSKRRKVYYASDLWKRFTSAERAALYKLETYGRVNATENNEPWIMNHIDRDPRFSYVAGLCAHVLSVPINTADDEYGAITVIQQAPKEQFFMGDVKLISAAARQIGVVIRNAALFRELRALFFNLVTSLVSMVEAKHKYTKGHSERVHKMACFLGKRLKLNVQVSDALHWASLFHDLGKISVPETVLNKPGKLTDEEFDIIKRHPVVGCEVLAPIEQLRDALPGIRHHHEKMDGSGYPSGLEGDDIPLTARIIAVADVYDALTSTRSYRPAMSQEKAIETMRAGMGTHFDPRVLNVFLDAHDEIARMADSSTGTSRPEVQAACK